MQGLVTRATRAGRGNTRAVAYIQKDWVYTPPIHTKARHSDEELLERKTNVGLSPAAALGNAERPALSE